MNSAIATTNTNELTMTSLEIAKYTGKEHKNVTRDIKKMVNELEFNLLKLEQVYIAGNGQEQTMLVLNRELTDCLLTGYSAKARMKVIKRWHELEAESQFKIPTTMHAALQLAADQALQLELAAPKVAFVDKYVTAEGNKGFREVAKLLQVNEREFREFLSEDKIMYKLAGGWVPYSNHINAGRFYVTTGMANDHVFTESKFTPKGIAWVDGLMKDLAENK